VTCQDCYSPECQVEAADRLEHAAWTEIGPDVVTQDAWKQASAALAAAQEACRKRSHTEGLLARIGALEARIAALETKP